MRFLPQRREISVIPFRNRQAHGGEHGVLLGLLEPALLLLDARSLGFFAFDVALRVPAEVAVLLPAAHGGHERVAQVVFALGVVFDVFPFEFGAAAAGRGVSVLVWWMGEWG